MPKGICDRPILEELKEEKHVEQPCFRLGHLQQGRVKQIQSVFVVDDDDNEIAEEEAKDHDEIFESCQEMQTHHEEEEKELFVDEE